MPLKAAGADLAYKGGMFSGTKYIGLIDSSDDEFTGNGYGRIAMTGFGGAAAWVADGEEYENRQVVQFAQPTGAAWPGIAKWGLYTAASSGDLLIDVDVNPDTAAPQIGASVSAAAQALAWGFTGFTADGSLIAMSAGILSGSRYLTLHTAAPGTNGASAIFTDGVVWNGSNQGGKTLVNVQIEADAWDLDTASGMRRARNNKVISYGAQTADLPDPTFVALRDGTAINSKVLWSNALTSPDPGLGATLRYTVNQIVIQLPIDT